MNIQWNIVNMDRQTADGFVVTAHYTVTATDGELSASTYGTVGFTQESDNFTPYEELTKEQVIVWVQDSLGKETVETRLADQIEAQRNPVQQSGTPWEVAQ